MIADLGNIYRKSIAGRHKLTFHFKKFNESIDVHIISRTSIEPLFFTELANELLLLTTIPYNCCLPSM